MFYMSSSSSSSVGIVVDAAVTIVVDDDDDLNLSAIADLESLRRFVVVLEFEDMACAVTEEAAVVRADLLINLSLTSF